MGACCGTAPNVRPETVDKTDAESKKMLLLGPGSSGKSTIVKQLKIIYGGSFTDKDRRDYKAQIENQIMEGMKKLILRQKELINENPSQYNHLKFENSESEASASFIEQLRITEELNDDIVKHVSILWKDRGIRNTFELRSKLAIPDSSLYFFDNLNQVADKNYFPTDNDILLVNKRTTAPIEETLQVENSKYLIWDVGGQRNERKKWVHTVENVSTLLFVVSLSSYAEVLFEDDSVISMHESLSLFEEIVNTSVFNNNHVRFALILNKHDLFQQLIEKVPINKCFPEYDGSNDYDSSISYIKDQFTKRIHNAKERNVLIYIINATSRTGVEKLFNDIRSANSRSQSFF